MNRAEIKRRILNGINDTPDHPVFFTDAQLDALINEALEFVVAETRAIDRSTFLALRANQTFYPLRGLAPDIMLPYRVWNYANTRRLHVTSMEELDQFQQRWQLTQADPQAWFSVSWDIIGVYPKPASTGGVLRVDYYAWATHLDDDASESEITPHDAIIDYGIYMGLLKQWDSVQATEIFKQLAGNEKFDKAKSQILRIGHRAMSRHELDFGNSFKEKP